VNDFLKSNTLDKVVNYFGFASLEVNNKFVGVLITSF